MALDMTPEQKETGKGNFNRVVGKLADQAAQDQADPGVTRRRFMQGLIAAGATVPVSAAAYFGYRSHGFPRDFRPVRAGIIGCGDEGGVLVGFHNPNYVKFVACADVRPSNLRRIYTGEANSPRKGLNHFYGSNAKDFIKPYEDYKQLLADESIEMIVIALPLHLHARVTIEALEAGKHVLCEKLMAWNIRQCKRMIRKADEKGLLLSIGHQRHYSMLYAHANEIVEQKLLGDIRHIRALWHRNNVRPNTDAATRNERPLRDSWWPVIPGEDRSYLTSEKFRQLGLNRDYESLEQLVRWRIYNKTGGGLMAELGSHQLDACSIFLGKKRPLSVTAVGGTHFYKEGRHPREVEDHVYCIYEFPGENYHRNPNSNRHDDIVTVTYSSISTNDFEPYGECVMGSKGTLVVEKEQNAYLWGLEGRSTSVTANTSGSAPVLDASSTAGPVEQRAVSTGQNALGQNEVSRGYREEMEHLAYCIRMRELVNESERDQFKPRCDGRAAMADAVIALTANQSMKTRQRIDFKDEWFDPASAEVPDPTMTSSDDQ